MTDVDVPFIFRDRSLYLPTARALVVADLHFGRAATSRVDAPVDDAGDVIARLETLLEAFSPETVAVAGDLLHSFFRVPRGVEEAVGELVATVEDADATLVVTPGNHDGTLETVYNGRATQECRLEDGTVVLHGHEPPTETATRYVVGHDHPTLSVDGRKHPCLLYGPEAYEGSDVVVLPAFTRLVSGSTVNRMSGDDFLTPLVDDPDAFHPAIRDKARGETLWFPPLGECRRLL